MIKVTGFCICWAFPCFGNRFDLQQFYVLAQQVVFKFLNQLPADSLSVVIGMYRHAMNLRRLRKMHFDGQESDHIFTVIDQQCWHGVGVFYVLNQ